MILEYGSVINDHSISVKAALLPDGTAFSNPGSIGGFGIKKWRHWRNIPTAVMAASGDHRGLPEWVEFVWSEPPYPEDPHMSLAEYRALPTKTQRLEIKSKVPQSVVDEVIASKRVAQPGDLADKTLWIYVFWTPDGMKMRWEMMDKKAGPGGFGPSVKAGGDDLDRFNQ